MIAAHGLTKRFGKFLAVDSVEFRIPRGEVVGFLGPNGAGKTTTIRMIAGSLPPTAGRVEIDGEPMTPRSHQLRQKIGYLPENTPLYPEMRVTEYLRFRAALYGLRGAARRERLGWVLDHCQLTDVRRKLIGHLSKGFRQRTGLAAALIHNPPLLILDEPTIGLDPAQIRQTRALIRDLAGEHTVLLSTHILPEVELTCDRVLMIAGGRIRAAGTVEQLREQAASRGRFVVETDHPEAEAAAHRVPAVTDVQCLKIDARWSRVIVTTDDADSDLREPLFRAMTTTGATVRELRRETASLEHLFVDLVSQDEAEQPVEPQPTGAAG